mgnify:FL=1
MPISNATCHPAKQNFGGGLCANCYYRKRYSENINGYREKKNISGKRWSDGNKGNINLWRKYKLKYRFNITMQAYESLLKKQSGRCAGCGGLPYGAIALSVDHDHRCCPGEKSCGKCIRGLLHSQCNFAISGAFDNPAVLRSLADYLERQTKEAEQATVEQEKLAIQAKKGGQNAGSER